MAKKHEPEHVSAEAGGLRWLLTYADLVTLLLASFVVLFATRDEPKPDTIRILQQAVRDTMFFVPAGDQQNQDKPFDGGEGVMDNVGRLIVKPKTTVDVDICRNMPAGVECPKKPKPPSISVCPPGVDSCKQIPEGTVMELGSDLLFDPGTATLRPEALVVFNKIGHTLDDRNMIRFEGHTDSDPISTAAFPSNWELSGARAAAVARYFIQTVGFPPSHVSIAGYGEFKPNSCGYLSSPKECNKSPEAKSKNRRVVITVINEKRQAAPGNTSEEIEKPVDTAPDVAPEATSEKSKSVLPEPEGEDQAAGFND